MVSLKIKLLAFFTEKIGSKHVFQNLWDTLYMNKADGSIRSVTHIHRLNSVHNNLNLASKYIVEGSTSFAHRR